MQLSAFKRGVCHYSDELNGEWRFCSVNSSQPTHGGRTLTKYGDLDQIKLEMSLTSDAPSANGGSSVSKMTENILLQTPILASTQILSISANLGAQML
jgi:hypothetical protein